MPFAAGFSGLACDSGPVVLIELLGGKSYPGAPILGYGPPARLEDLATILATWRTLEAFSYSTPGASVV